MATTKPVAQWQLNDAKAEISRAVNAVPLGAEGYAITYDMIERHEFWKPGGKEGRGWAGQRGPGDGAIEQRILKMVQPMFTPDDVVGEMVKNVENGLLTREPTLAFTPVEEPDPEEEPDEAEEEAKKARLKMIGHAIARWWDRKKLWERAGEAVRRATWSGRGHVRLRIAAANLNGGQLATGLDIDDALSRIEIDTPLPDAAMVYRDPETERDVGVVVSKVADQDTAEIWTTERAGAATGGELTTAARVIGAKGVGAPVNITGLQLGGRIPVFELRLDPLITEPLRQSQFQINYMKTVLGRTVEAAGYKQRHFGNVEPPLMWFNSPPENEMVVKIVEDVPGRKMYGVRQPWVFGAGQVIELIGLEEVQADGRTKLRKDPVVHVDEPTDTQFVTNPIDRARGWLYKAGKQGHLGGASTIELSGDAYEQARAQHEADLQDRAGPTTSFVRDIIECVCALGGLMSSDLAGFIEEYRAVITMHVTAGPLRPEAARLVSEQRDKGLISTETAQSRLGVEDTAAENELLESDLINQLAIKTKQAAFMQQLTMAGVAQHVAAHMAGFTIDEIEMMLTDVIPGLEEIELPEEEPANEDTPPGGAEPDNREGNAGTGNLPQRSGRNGARANPVQRGRPAPPRSAGAPAR